MKTQTIQELFSGTHLHQKVSLQGWVRTFRANRFIALNDGSTLNNLQCVVDFEQTDENLLKRITTGAAVHIEGTLVESQGKGQKYEVQVSHLKVIGDSDPDQYPIQPNNLIPDLNLWIEHCQDSPLLQKKPKRPTDWLIRYKIN